MADWPDTAELAQIVDVENVADWQTTLDRVRASAIATVKDVRGDWDDDVDEPDEKLAQAALRLATLISAQPDRDRRSLISDSTFQTLMYGRRRRFGIA